MPTELKRRLVRETSTALHSRGESRRIIVELEAGGQVMFVRLKGSRKRFPVAYSSLYTWAVQNWVLAERRRKAAERRAKTNGN